METDLGIPLSRLDTMLDIHWIKSDCTWDFQGRLYLDDKKDTVGVPAGKIMVLEALYITTGFLGQSTTDFRSATLFTPKPGVKYLMEIIYKNKIFSADIFELTASGKKGKQVERIPPSSCSAAMRSAK
ncbi:MAG: hypothetical protein ACOY5B_07405 [Spirochaetota bacterium]